MCFRPADSQMASKACSQCGTENGYFDAECKECGEPLGGNANGPTGAHGAPPVPGAPSAAGMPKGPGMPKAPGAPPTPGAPSAPGMPKAPGAK